MAECQTLKEVRENIDRLDEVLVKVLVERSDYVRQAARFKPTRDQVRIPSRMEEVVNNAKKSALRYGGNPDLVERVYREILEASIAYETKVHDQTNPA